MALISQDGEFIKNFTLKQHRENLAEAHHQKWVSISGAVEEAILISETEGLEGVRMPWPKTHELFTFREGAVSVLAGINGHGKSTVASQIMLHACTEICTGVMSLEMGLADQLIMMSQQAVCRDGLTRDDLHRTDDFLTANHMWFYEHFGMMKIVEVYGAIWAAYKRGVRFLVIDNLQKCGLKYDSDVERDFVAEIIGIAKATKMHIVLVHHVRKPNSATEAYRPNKFDLKGSGSLSDQPDNLIIVWSNKERKEIVDAMLRGEPISQDEDNFLEDEVDYEIFIAKNRHARFEGKIKLYSGKGRTLKETDGDSELRIDLTLRPQCKDEAEAVNKAPEDAGVNLNDFSWGGNTTNGSDAFELEEF